MGNAAVKGIFGRQLKVYFLKEGMDLKEERCIEG